MRRSVPAALLLSLCTVVPAAQAMPEAAPSAADAEHVVLLHGLGRSDRSMLPLAERIAAGGYRAFTVDYPSTALTPDELAGLVGDAIETCCAAASRIHFVTHSLGGILVRIYLAQTPDPRVGRVVMLSPPNRGSELVDLLGDTRVFESLMGPTAVQLGTDADSLPNRLPAPEFQLGVIAATGTINPLGSAVIPGEDDGIVSLCSMWTEGVDDMITVPDSHALVMRSREVARQVLHFLAEGSFDRDAAGAADEVAARCASAAR